tara:strand:- start:232 stop:477 length:246 start_codon:yes stop_codon:yes gene_type:complete
MMKIGDLVRLRRVFVRSPEMVGPGNWRSTTPDEDIVGIIVEITHDVRRRHNKEEVYRVTTTNRSIHSEDAWLYSSEMEKID